MVKLPYELSYGDFIIRVVRGNHCYRWDVLDGINQDDLHSGFEETIELAISEAFDWLNDNADYMEDAA